LTIILSAGLTFLYGIYRKYPLKENFYFIPNHLLYGKLVEGVGGATWYGKDSLVLIFFMKYKIFLGFLLFFSNPCSVLFFSTIEKKTILSSSSLSFLYLQKKDFIYSYKKNKS
jgi:hypothetical protein